MRNFLLWLRYDGTDFHGWQRQANARSVQGELETALGRILGEGFRLGSSSRTDAGVHALNHPVNVWTPARIPADGLRKGLSSLLPRDLAVTEVIEAPEHFSARKSSIGKTYLYRILQGDRRDPFVERYAWRIRHHLDVEAMRQGAACLLGEHDFSAFRSSECDSPSPWRLVTGLPVWRDGREIRIVVSGNAFLRNMVRIIVGCLAEVGTGRHDPEWMNELLVGRDRTRAGITAPARGLHLWAVSYAPDLLCDGAYEW